MRNYIETFVGWSAIITALVYNNVWLLVAGFFLLATRQLDHLDDSK